MSKASRLVATPSQRLELLASLEKRSREAPPQLLRDHGDPHLILDPQQVEIDPELAVLFAQEVYRHHVIYGEGLRGP